MLLNMWLNKNINIIISIMYYSLSHFHLVPCQQILFHTIGLVCMFKLKKPLKLFCNLFVFYVFTTGVWFSCHLKSQKSSGSFCQRWQPHPWREFHSGHRTFRKVKRINYKIKAWDPFLFWELKICLDQLIFSDFLKQSNGYFWRVQ